MKQENESSSDIPDIVTNKKESSTCPDWNTLSDTGAYCLIVTHYVCHNEINTISSLHCLYIKLCFASDFPTLREALGISKPNWAKTKYCEKRAPQKSFVTLGAIKDPLPTSSDTTGSPGKYISIYQLTCYLIICTITFLM